MLAPGGREPVEIVLEGDDIGARGYIDLTCAAMRHFGARVAQRGSAAWVVEPGSYRAADLYAQGQTLRQICAQLGVHRSTVSQ